MHRREMEVFRAKEMTRSVVYAFLLQLTWHPSNGGKVADVSETIEARVTTGDRAIVC